MSGLKVGKAYQVILYHDDPGDAATKEKTVLVAKDLGEAMSVAGASVSDEWQTALVLEGHMEIETSDGTRFGRPYAYFVDDQAMRWYVGLDSQGARYTQAEKTA